MAFGLAYYFIVYFCMASELTLSCTSLFQSTPDALVTCSAKDFFFFLYNSGLLCISFSHTTLLLYANNSALFLEGMFSGLMLESYAKRKHLILSLINVSPFHLS